MKVFIPNSAFIGNIDPFLKSLDLSNDGKLEITAHKQWVSVHPVVLSMIASLGIGLNPENIFCEKLEMKSKGYLERMGLFKMLGIESGIQITEHESAGRFIPLTRITNTFELDDFLKEMIPLLHLKPEHTEAIKYIVSELVRNVLEHASAGTGAIVSAQYYKKSNRFSIGIVDRGIGIKSSINQSYSVDTNIKAIQLALTPGITGTTSIEGGTEFNAGAGLFFIKSIATVNRDLFMLYSGDALYKLLRIPEEVRISLHTDPFKDRHSVKENLPFWQGTVVGVDIDLDDTEKFSKLLDYIRNAYLGAIRERKRVRIKRPKFL